MYEVLSRVYSETRPLEEISKKSGVRLYKRCQRIALSPKFWVVNYFWQLELLSGIRKSLVGTPGSVGGYSHLFTDLTESSLIDVTLVVQKIL